MGLGISLGGGLGIIFGEVLFNDVGIGLAIGAGVGIALAVPHATITKNNNDEEHFYLSPIANGS